MDNLKIMLLWLLMFWNTFMVIIKIIALIGTWRTTQENSATIILHGSGLGQLISLILLRLYDCGPWLRHYLIREGYDRFDLKP
jgi:hypothetical protein